MAVKHTPVILRLKPMLKRMNRFMRKIYGARFPGRRMILLMTTTGRKSGEPRVTPLQYELIDGIRWVGSGWGMDADWLKNIRRNPHVTVQVGGDRYNARTELIEDVARVTDFLKLRLDRHPLMIGLMLRAQGLPVKYNRQDLERLAMDIIVVKLNPVN
jgi:deazaflavin-dependent oxidoreductase (nitroreductase family)